jgi:hypothetical protein
MKKVFNTEEMNDLIKTFAVDTWVFHAPTQTVSKVFIGWEGTIEPFVQIGDFDKDNYKILSDDEVMEVEA